VGSCLGGDGVIFSTDPQPPRQPRWRDTEDTDPVTVLGRPATPPTPAMSSVELLAELLHRLAASERAAAERHEEVLRRFAAIEKAIADVADTAGLGRSDIEDLHRYTGEGFEVVMETLNEVADVVAPLDDDEG
jgi:hypothetical protein